MPRRTGKKITGNQIDFITLSDKPLEKTETEKTPLGRYINLLFEDIRQHFSVNPSGSWQITLEAPRGAGKTSALKMLYALLENNEDYLVVRFNSWDLPDSQGPDARRILGHLAVHVAMEIERNSSKSEDSDKNKNKSKDHDKKCDVCGVTLPRVIYRNLLKFAGQLLPGTNEAGQAAIAFGADADDYLSVFREKLSSIGAANEYFKELGDILGKTGGHKDSQGKPRILAILADDVDWRTPITTEFLTALSHFRAHERVLIVCAAYRPWVEVGLQASPVLKPILDKHRGDTSSVLQSLLGQELPLPYWSSSRQISFFVTPDLNRKEKMLWMGA